MTIPIRQSTASQEIPLGYFLDNTDGDKEEETLGIANTDIKLWKHGATTLANKNSGGATHISDGIYYCVLDATDSDTLGALEIFVHVSGALAIKVECRVLPAHIYDTLVLGTDKLEVDLIQMNGVAQSALDLKDFADAGYDPATNKVQGVVLVDTTTTNTDMVGTNGANTVVPDAAGVAPTAAEIRIEMDNNSADLNLILADTDDLQTNQGNWATATGFATATALTTHDGKLDTVDANVDAILVDTGTTLDGKINTIDTNVDAVLVDTGTTLDGKIDTIDTNVDAILVDTGTTLEGHLTDIKGGTFVGGTDSLEAIRDRGDAAWTTGGGGSISDILNVQALIPNSIDLANTATVRIAIGLTNMLDDLPTTAEITPGTITIDRKAIGGTSWTNIVNAAACSEAAGLIYYDEVFDSGTGYAAADSIRVTFKSQKITVAANDYEITGTDGWIFQTHIRTTVTSCPSAVAIRTEMDSNSTRLSAIEADTTGIAGAAMRGTDSAALATVCTEARLAELDAANLITDVANVKTDTAAILVDTGTTLDGKIDTIDTNVDTILVDTGTTLDGKIDTIDANVDAVLADTGTDGVLLAATATSAQLVDDVWDELLTGATHNIATSAGRRVREVGAFAIHSGTAQAGTSTSITLAATANGGDGVYNRNLIVVVDGTGKGQTRTIVDYDDTTKIVVADRDWRITPDATSEYQIVPDDTPLTVDHGKAQGGTATTITLRAYASSVNDTYLCNQVTIIAGTGRGQVRLIGAYNGTTKVATVCGDNWVTTPDTTSIYAMMPYGTTCTSCMGTHALTQVNTECDTALTDYDPPTRTEATTDKDAIITEVNANETKIDTIDTVVDTIKAKTDNLPSGIAKNVALSDFQVLMVLSSDHVTPATGKTIAGTISKDGAAFASLTNAVSELSSGMYVVDVIQAEMNADVVTLKFTETDCDQRIITIYTS